MKVKIALDWSPNTIHAGILLAESKGFFKEQDLNVEIISPEADDYSVYPIEKAQNGWVDIAMCPSEHVLAWNANGIEMIAVATVFQKDMSAYIYHPSKGIKTPKDLDGKLFASYETNFELELLKDFIQNAGGNGVFETLKPGKLSVWETFLEKKADLAWVFTTWEGVDAELKGQNIGYFFLPDNGIPYGPSPIFCVCPKTLATKTNELSLFFKALSKGYQYASANPESAAEELCSFSNHKNFENNELVAKSLIRCSTAFLNPDNLWGKIEESRWNKYVEYLVKKEFIEEPKLPCFNSYFFE